MKMKNCRKQFLFYVKLFALSLVLFLISPGSGCAQVLRITEALSWMNNSQEQVLNLIGYEHFVFQGKEGGFFKFNKKYSLGVCNLSVAFKNRKLDAISWSEYVGYAGELRGEVSLANFQQVEAFDILSGFKNYDRRLSLTLYDHSATANEIGIAIGRLKANDSGLRR